MAESKEIAYVINDIKAGKTYQKKTEESFFRGKKIGETVPGSALGLTGYELQITGGSDKIGFPMLKNIDGPGRKKVLLSKGTGAQKKIKRKGMIIRRTVVGNTVGATTHQVNLKVSKYGTKPIPELLGIEKKEEKPAEKKEAAKEEAKPEAKKEPEKKEEKKE